MSAPIDFTSDEKAALGTIDSLTDAIARTDREIAKINRGILASKAKRDRLIERKRVFQQRVRRALDLIDTIKNTPEVP